MSVLVSHLAFIWGPFSVSSPWSKSSWECFCLGRPSSLRSITAADAHTTEAGFYLASWDLNPVQQVFSPGPLGSPLASVVCWLLKDLTEQITEVSFRKVYFSKNTYP